MSKIYISELASPTIISYLLERGHSLFIIGGNTTQFDNHPEVTRLEAAKQVASPISCHPDILHCHLGNGHVFHGDPEKLAEKYPGDVLYNACSTGKYFIHNLKYTAPELIAEAEKMSLEMVHVPQGYTKCSICVVDENSVITYDKGIAAACALRAPALNVLQVSPGHIKLPGYAEGFIGGTGGRVGSAVIFNGNLSAHPDFTKIKEFIESRGLECIWSEDIPLTDIGSVTEEK